MKKQILENADITSSSKQIAILKQHFPACFDKDGKFLPAKLTEIAQAEGADITREGYSLNWLGKSYARLLAKQFVTQICIHGRHDWNAYPNKEH